MLIQQKWTHLQRLFTKTLLTDSPAALRTSLGYERVSGKSLFLLRALQLPASSRTETSTPDTPKTAPRSTEELLLYRWPTMKHFRFISKLKIYQISFMLVMLPPSIHWYSVDKLTATALGYGGVALMGTAAVLGVISHFFSKLVGELHYYPQDDAIRVSTLTFWGNRKEEKFPAANITMFVESQTRMGGAFQKLELRGHKKTYAWSIQYGRVLDLECLCKVLKISDTDLTHF